MKISNPDIKHIPQLRALWQEAFGDSEEFLDLFFTSAFCTERSVCITEINEVIAALYWFDCTLEGHKIAYIYAVATSIKHRSKGHCRKLMEHTHTKLSQNGYKAAVLVPGSKGLFDMYEKLSYKICSYVNESEFAPSSNKTEITQISKDEFAALRKTYLPKNAVIQEKENLDFLASYAEFYKGKDFVFVCSKDKEKLIVSEILGNTNDAACIVNTLGCKQGFFRTAGKLRPFAMWYDLSEGSISAPGYFGLAFD